MIHNFTKLIRKLDSINYPIVWHYSASSDRINISKAGCIGKYIYTSTEKLRNIGESTLNNIYDTVKYNTKLKLIDFDKLFY